MVMLSSGQHLKAPWPNRCCGVRFELAPVKGIGLAPSIGAHRATKVVPLLQTNKREEQLIIYGKYGDVILDAGSKSGLISI